MTASSRCRTPKLVRAEPTNTGEVIPARNVSGSWEASTASSRPISSIAADQALPSSSAALSADISSSGAIAEPRTVRVKRVNVPSRRSMTPRKSPEMPTGHVTGVGFRPICSSISSRSSRGSLPGRSYLLRKVITGSPRSRQTSKSFKVWGSMPFAESSTITTESTAERTR